MDQAEQDIEELAIKASVSFIQFYDSSTTVAIGKAIKSVEGLMLKFNDIGNDNPDGNCHVISEWSDLYQRQV